MHCYLGLLTNPWQTGQDVVYKNLSLQPATRAIFMPCIIARLLLTIVTSCYCRDNGLT